MLFGLLKLVMKIWDIELIVDKNPVAIICNVIDSDYTTRGRIFESCTRDSTLSKFDCLIDSKVPSILCVKDTVSESTSRTDSEKITWDSGSIIINIVEVSTVLVWSGEHTSHAQSISSVLFHHIAEHHWCHWNSAKRSISELIDSAKHSNVLFPELTVSSSTRHSSKDEIVNLNNLSHLVGRDKRTLSSSCINCNQNTSLELESKGCGTLGKVSHLWCHLFELSLEFDLINTWGHLEVELI